MPSTRVGVIGIGHGRLLTDGHRLRRRFHANPEKPGQARGGGGNEQGDEPLDFGIVHGECPLSGTP